MMRFVQYVYNKCQRRYTEQELRRKTIDDFLEEQKASPEVWKQFSAFLTIWNTLAERGEIPYECDTIVLGKLKRKARVLFALSSETPEGQRFKIVLTILATYQNELLRRVWGENGESNLRKQKQPIFKARLHDMIRIKKSDTKDKVLSSEGGNRNLRRRRTPEWLKSEAMKETRKQLIYLWKKNRDSTIIRQHIRNLNPEQLAEALAYLRESFDDPDEGREGADPVENKWKQVPNLLALIKGSSTRLIRYGKEANISYDLDAIEASLRQQMVSGSKILEPKIIDFDFIGTTCIERLWKKLVKNGLQPKLVEDGVMDKITRGMSAHGLQKLVMMLEETISFAAKWPTKKGEAFGKIPLWKFCKSSLKMEESE